MALKAYRADIDGLRALAVATVVLFHLGVPGVGGGYVGVDVFFVISGYLITSLIRNEAAAGEFSFGRFYTRRARRLFPALVVTLAASFLAAYLMFSPAYFEEFSNSFLYAITSLSNVYFWNEAGYFDTESIYKPLLHTWTLSVEEQFYLIWPALLLLAIAIGKEKGTLAAVIMAGLLSFAASLAIQFGLLAQLTGTDWLGKWGGVETLFYLTPFRIFEFAIGAILIWLPPASKRPNILLEALFLIGLALIILPVTLYDETTYFPGLAALAPCLGAGLAIYAGQNRHSSILLRNSVVVWIGKLSYSLYLVHWPLIVFWSYYTFQPLSVLDQIAILLLTFAFATLMYYLVEQPFRRMHPSASGVARAPRLSNGGFGVACLLIAICGTVLSATVIGGNGWTFRIPPERLADAPEVDPAADLALGASVCPPIRVPDWDFDEQPCEFGVTTKPGVDYYLVGDSHGRAMLVGMHEEFQRYGLKGVFISTQDSKVPLLGVNLSLRGEQLPSADSAIEYVLSGTKPKGVILNARWSIYLNGAEPDDRGWVLTSDTLPNAEPGAALSAGFRQTIDQLTAADIEVYVIGQVPYAGKDPAGCRLVPSWVLTNRALEERCQGLAFAEKMQLAKPAIDVIQSLSDLPGVHAFSPVSALCGSDYCQTVADSLQLYRDDDHLNQHGSRLVAKAFMEASFGTESRGDLPVGNVAQADAGAAPLHVDPEDLEKKDLVIRFIVQAFNRSDPAGAAREFLAPKALANANGMLTARFGASASETLQSIVYDVKRIEAFGDIVVVRSDIAIQTSAEDAARRSIVDLFLIEGGKIVDWKTTFEPDTE